MITKSLVWDYWISFTLIISSSFLWFNRTNCRLLTSVLLRIWNSTSNFLLICFFRCHQAEVLQSPAIELYLLNVWHFLSLLTLPGITVLLSDDKQAKI